MIIGKHILHRSHSSFIINLPLTMVLLSLFTSTMSLIYLLILLFFHRNIMYLSVLYIYY